MIDKMSYIQIFEELNELNQEAYTFIYNDDYLGFQTIIDDFLDSGITELDNFETARRLYRNSKETVIFNGVYCGKKVLELFFDDVPLKVFDYPEFLSSMVQSDEKNNLADLITLENFIKEHHGMDEYEYEKYDRDVKKKSTPKERKDRLQAIIEFMKLYNKLYENDNIFKNGATNNLINYQQRYVDKVIELVKCRQKYFLTYNFLFIEYDDPKTGKQPDFNKKLENKSLPEKINILNTSLENIYEQEKNNKTINLRNYLKFENEQPIRITNYIDAKGMSRTTWKNYKKCKFVNNKMFYIQLAFFLNIPSSKEVEKFLTHHGYSIASNFHLFKTIEINKKPHHILDKDLRKWIDAGIDYNLINEILGYRIEIKELKHNKSI